jgi:hypothetical protein
MEGQVDIVSKPGEKGSKASVLESCKVKTLAKKIFFIM